MIGLDTHVIVRYLTEDDAIESQKAAETIQHRLSSEKPDFLSVVEMVETVWVLDRVYGLGDQEIARTIERMLQIDVLLLEYEPEVFTAMIALKEGRGSFADALIAALGDRAGSE
jgi:predicted nucleic-acid-binding protein